MLRRKLLERRMRPGADSEGGFLGPNESLGQVLRDDAGVLRELKLTRRALAERLGQLLEAYRWAHAARRPAGEEPFRRPTDEEIELLEEALDPIVRVAGRFDVTETHYWGWQECPWRGIAPWACRKQDRLRYATFDWEIRNLRTDQRLAGPGLIVHLIAAHGFFEAPESPYRVDPRELAALLELSP